MNSQIDFRINYEKAIETIVLLANEKPGIDIYHMGKVKKTTHNERCWLKTSPNQPIDYTLLVDEDNPNREEILKEMSETAAYLQV